MHTGMCKIGQCIFHESCICLEIRSFSIYHVTPCTLRIIAVEIEITIILGFWSLVVRNTMYAKQHGMWNNVTVKLVKVVEVFKFGAS